MGGIVHFDIQIHGCGALKYGVAYDVYRWVEGDHVREEKEEKMERVVLYVYLTQ